MDKKKCPICGKMFVPLCSTSKVCTDPTCRREWSAAQSRRYYAEKVNRNETCLVCGKPLPMGKKKYCSADCDKVARTERVRKKQNWKGGTHVVYRTCVDCGKLAATNGAGIRCAECQQKHWNEINRKYVDKWWKEHPRQQTPKEMHTCPICGQVFLALKKSYVVCGPECRKTYYAQKKHEIWVAKKEGKADD